MALHDDRAMMAAPMRERFVIVATTFAVIAFVSWPASWDQGRDSFPMSPYPMFARKKTSPLMTLEYAVAINGTGERSYVAPGFVGSAEVLQARALLRGAIARGQESADSFCQGLLGRLGASASHRDVVELRLVRGTHDAVSALRGDKSASVETVVATCYR